jgi:hypothetical protein
MISYARMQRPLAERLHEGLKSGECEPKLDYLDIPDGDRWHQTIAWWLSACQVAVVLLSKQAMASPWVRYELSVLKNRELVERNMRLVVVYLSVTRQHLADDPEFGPLRLDEIESHHELPDDHPDDQAVAELVKAVHDLPEFGDTPVDRLVGRVSDELRAVGSTCLKVAQSHLPRAADPVEADPWVLAFDGAGDDAGRAQGFAECYCSTPLHGTARALQELAQDLDLRRLDTLVDLSVMTTFDSQAVDRLRRAALSGARRSLVTATTRADLAHLATQTVRVLHNTPTALRFELIGTVAGLTPTQTADRFCDEFLEAVGTRCESDETADDYLALEASFDQPVYALLTSAVGITPDVLTLLEQRFPSVVFVVLSSQDRPMQALASELGVEGAGPDLADESAWAAYVAHERELSDKRDSLRTHLRHVKQGTER